MSVTLHSLYRPKQVRVIVDVACYRQNCATIILEFDINYSVVSLPRIRPANPQ